MIHVIATINLAEGTRDLFLEEFHKLVPDVHAEDGCIEYGPTVDVDSGSDAQIPVRSNTVTVVEKWESLDHLAAHSVAPHMESYRERVADYVQSVSLQILTPA